MRLEVQDLSVELGSARVVDGVSFAAASGELLGLIGPNGAGKTTLLRAVLGVQPALAGTVRIDGRARAAIPRRALAQRLAYLPQGGFAHWPMNVEHVVALGRLAHQPALRGPARDDLDAVARAMRAADVEHLRGRPVTRLSGGERMRVHLARVIAGEPEIVLADEPVASLDPAHQLRVMSLLAALAADGGTVVVVLHDLTLAARYCRRVLLMDAGRVAAAGTPDAVLSAANLAATYGIEAVSGEHDHERFIVPWRVADDATRQLP